MTQTPTDALRLVPVEPTKAMLAAGQAAGDYGDALRRAWSAMLSAAPTVPLSTPMGGVVEALREVKRFLDGEHPSAHRGVRRYSATWHAELQSIVDEALAASSPSPAQSGEAEKRPDEDYRQTLIRWAKGEVLIRPETVAKMLLPLLSASPQPEAREARIDYLRKSRDGHAATAHAEFGKRVMATDALISAREALHQHYVDWDGEPEDAVPLQEARAECDRVLDILLAAPPSVQPVEGK